MIEILKFDPIDKGTLQGKITIKMHKWGGFCIEDIALMKKEDKRWLGFPSKKTQVDGQDKWVPLVYFESANIQRKFCDEILKAYDIWKK